MVLCVPVCACMIQKSLMFPYVSLFWISEYGGNLCGSVWPHVCSFIPLCFFFCLELLTPVWFCKVQFGFCAPGYFCKMYWGLPWSDGNKLDPVWKWVIRKDPLRSCAVWRGILMYFLFLLRSVQSPVFMCVVVPICMFLWGRGLPGLVLYGTSNFSCLIACGHVWSYVVLHVPVWSYVTQWSSQLPCMILCWSV